METLKMKHASMRITMACNLNCALCAAYAPYVTTTSAHFPFVHLKNSLAKFFEIVDYTDKFTITGGEPLLHPDFPNYLALFQQYAGKVGVIEIISNGTVVPGRELLSIAEELGEGKVSFLIDHYGISKKIPELQRLFDENRIRYTIRDYHTQAAHCNGWVDFGDLTQKKRERQEEIEALYAKCAHPQKLQFCFIIRDGIMYPCAPCEVCHELGVTTGNDHEYIDLFDDSLTVEEQRRKIRNIYAGKSLSACAYCNGMCDDSQRYTPAVQLTQEELRCVKNGARSYHEVCAMLGRKGT